MRCGCMPHKPRKTPNCNEFGKWLVIGFDGLALGEYLTPRLATIGQSVERLAQEATATLLDAIETGAPARRVTVPFTVISGESVGDAPAV